MIRCLPLILIPCFALVLNGCNTSRSSPSPNQAAQDQSAQTQDYRAFLARFTTPLAQSVEFRITISPFDDVGNNAVGATAGNGFADQVVTLDKDGNGRFDVAVSFGSGGGGIGPVSTAQMKTAQEVVQRLPAGLTHLPPHGRRTIVQAASTSGEIVRIYDRANLPDEVQALYRLSGQPGITRWVPTFRPDTMGGRVQISQDRYNSLQFSADASQIAVLTDKSLSISYWMAPQTIQTLQLGSDDENALAVADDGIHAAICNDIKCTLVSTGKHWGILKELAVVQTDNGPLGVSRPHFSDDGKYLICRSQHQVVIFDTNTWKNVLPPNFITPDCIAYEACSRLAVAQLKNTSADRVVLWNPLEKREIATLTHDTELEVAAFSPDTQMVAVLTRAEPDSDATMHLKVFECQTGKLLHELRVGDVLPIDNARWVSWSADGKFILCDGMSNMDYPSVACMWNAKTGRCCGKMELEIWTSRESTCSKDGKFLAAIDGGSNLNIWNLQAVEKQITDFENSLSKN